MLQKAVYVASVPSISALCSGYTTSQTALFKQWPWICLLIWLQGALLSDISKGPATARLKKVAVNDRSAPIIDNKGSTNSGPPPMAGAPPIPGMKVPGGLAPPTPGGGNRGRSNSDTGGGASDPGGIGGAPQLGGLFAGGMPKLKKRSGGVSTGAGGESSYSDSETSRPAAVPRPPGIPGLPSAPAPSIPKANGLRPSPMLTESAPAVPSPSANLKKVPPKPASKPSTASLALGKPPPPPPIAARKNSGLPPPAPPPPPLSASPLPPPLPTSSSPAPPAPPPPPPTSISPAPPSAPPAPPLPPSTVPSQTPPSRYTAPLPPPPPPPGLPPNSAMTNGSHSRRPVAEEYDPYRYSSSAAPPPSRPAGSAAMAAAVSAFASRPSSSISHTSHTPPAPPAPPSSAPSAPSAPPPSFGRPPATQAPSRSTMDPSSYTLSNNPSSYTLTNGSANTSSPGRGSTGAVDDRRWKFQDESQLPPPRQFTGVPKRYRAGRGSSVPLDLSSLG